MASRATLGARSESVIKKVTFCNQGVLETIKFFFQFEPKQTETRSVSVVFWFVSRNQKTFFSVCFGWFRCFGPVSKQPKQTELSRNKPKKSPKNVLYQGVLENGNFFSRFELKQTATQSVSVVFWFAFSRNHQIFLCLFRCFEPVSKRPKQTELMVWEIKKVDILTNLLLFWLVFCLFRLFRNTETPCFNIKAKQPKQTSCLGQCRNQFRFQFRLFRYETNFGGLPICNFQPSK